MNYNSTKNRTHISLDGYNANIIITKPYLCIYQTLSLLA